MSRDIRREPHCYYASADYAESFWGKYLWIYEGRGSLRLTADALRLERGRLALEIPLDTIKGIGLGRFSSWAKPIALERLVVDYSRDGVAERIYLIPYRSAFAPVWETSRLVEEWYETLGQFELLAGRVGPPPPPEPVARLGPLWAVAVAVALAVTLGLMAWLVGSGSRPRAAPAPVPPQAISTGARATPSVSQQPVSSSRARVKS